MAGHKMPFHVLPQNGFFPFAAFHTMCAPGMEWTARWRIHGRRHVAFEHDALLFFMKDRNRHCAEQCLGVWMHGMCIQCLGIRQLHYIPQVHHSNAVRHILYDAQIMRDEKERNSGFPLQAAHQIEQLRLDGYVQCGNRLVTNDKLWLHHQSFGHADPLALTTGKLMRIPLHILRLKIHAFQRIGYHLCALLPAASSDTMNAHGFVERFAYGMHRIE